MAASRRKFSFTMLNTFLICPFKFHYAYVLYQKEPSTPEMDEGNRVHKIFEDVFAGRAPMTPEVNKYKIALAPLQENRCTMAEKSLGMTAQGERCGYNEAGVYFRAKSDLLILPPHLRPEDVSPENPQLRTAYYLDWKTGNPNYPKMDQVEWTTLLIFANYPWVTQIASRLAFIGAKGERLYPDEEWHIARRADIPKVRATLDDVVAKVEAADNMGVYPKTPNKLCAYCAVKKCEHAERA